MIRLDPFRHLLTQWSRILLEKLIVSQIVKKFLAFYRNRKFITAFIKARRWSLSWARCIQYTLFHPISLRFIILSSHVHPCLFLSGFPAKMLFASLISPIRATWPTNLILLDLTTLIIFGEAHKLWNAPCRGDRDPHNIVLSCIIFFCHHDSWLFAYISYHLHCPPFLLVPSVPFTMGSLTLVFLWFPFVVLLYPSICIVYGFVI
jgi:hypothetical protein